MEKDLLTFYSDEDIFTRDVTYRPYNTRFSKNKVGLTDDFLEKYKTRADVLNEKKVR